MCGMPAAQQRAALAYVLRRARAWVRRNPVQGMGVRAQVGLYCARLRMPTNPHGALGVHWVHAHNVASQYSQHR